MLEASLCLHCSQPIGNSILPGFCCRGCQTVYQLLSSGPLSEYYRIREGGVCFTPPSRFESRNSDWSFWNENQDQPLRVFVEGIHCTACVWLLERLPLALPEDVISSNLDLSRSQVTLNLHPEASRSRIASTLESFGYRPHLIGSRSEGERLLEVENRRRLIDLGIAGALAGNVMLMSIPLYSGVGGGFRSLFEWISFVLSIPSVFYSGRSFFKNVAAGLRHRIFPIDGPILLAILTAWGWSVFSLIRETHDLYFDSLTSLVFLLLGSRYYLARVRQASGLNPGLLSYFHAPFRGSPGDQLVLAAGTQVPFDGKVLAGRAWMDLSPFTGEADPVAVGPGGGVHAGTRIVAADPGFLVRVEKVGVQTRLQKLLSRIEESRERRTVREQATERWARALLLGVLLVGGGAGWFFLGAGLGAEGLRRILALLIVTCPCALALATPMVYSLATGGLLREGVLLRTPEALDRVLEVRDIFFDKTGTLTFGDLRIPERDLAGLSLENLRILAALTERSHHPVSRALYRETHRTMTLEDRGRIEEWQELPGSGVEGRWNGVRYGVRKHPDFGTFGVQFWRESSGIEEELAVLRFEDRIRADSEGECLALRRLGYRLQVLTGDHLANAEAVLQGLPIGISAGRTPEEKARDVVSGMMVGDGVNDAWALSEARVGVAVQGGMEAAIDSADVYFLKPGISGVRSLIIAARRVRILLRTNFAISTGYNLLGAALALSGEMSPLVAAVLMPVSATTVFANSAVFLRRRGR